MALISQVGFDAAAEDEPLLSFDLTTSPDPLKASPENTTEPQEKGELIIVGARRDRTPADIEWIKVKVPAGAMAPDLATDLAPVAARISLDGWTVQLSSSTDEFVFTPTAAYAEIGPDTGLTIQLTGIPISRLAGSSPITVTEQSRTGNQSFREREVVFSVGKFPADFYLRNFICDPLVIDNGGQVTLTWERSTNATYQLLHGDTDLDVTNISTRTISNVKSDTTFYLRGTIGTPSGSVTRILSTQVTVRKPDLEIGNLIVHGTLAAGPSTLTSLTVEYSSRFNGTSLLQGRVTGNSLLAADVYSRGLAFPFEPEPWERPALMWYGPHPDHSGYMGLRKVSTLQPDLDKWLTTFSGFVNFQQRGAGEQRISKEGNRWKIGGLNLYATLGDGTPDDVRFIMANDVPGTPVNMEMLEVGKDPEGVGTYVYWYLTVDPLKVAGDLHVSGEVLDNSPE